MAPDEPPAGRRRALLVATATYSDPGSPRCVRRPATSRRWPRCSATRRSAASRSRADRPADRGPAREIEDVLRRGRPQDLLLLYVSGHGVLSQSRRFYFATANTTLRVAALDRDRGRLRQRRDAVQPRPLDRARARLLPQRRVRQGTRAEERDLGRRRAPLRGPRPGDALGVDRARVRVRGDRPATASTSSARRPPARCSPAAWSRGCSSGDADIDEDGRITVDDLYDYVCRRVRERSVHQTPGMAGDIRGEIVIARSGRRPELPPELASRGREQPGGDPRGRRRRARRAAPAGGGPRGDRRARRARAAGRG